MVLFGRLSLGLFWEGVVPPTPPSVACTSAVMSRHCLLHSVLVRFQQSISGVGGVQTFLCEQRESQLSQAVLFPSPFAFGIYKYDPWATIKSGLLPVKIPVVPSQRADVNSQEKQIWPSVPCLDFVVVWKGASGSAVGLALFSN